ncbi:MAG: hypothetical protein U7123_05700 [Potamolinea sp.]
MKLFAYLPIFAIFLFLGAFPVQARQLELAACDNADVQCMYDNTLYKLNQITQGCQETRKRESNMTYTICRLNGKGIVRASEFLTEYGDGLGYWFENGQVIAIRAFHDNSLFVLNQGKLSALYEFDLKGKIKRKTQFSPAERARIEKLASDGYQRIFQKISSDNKSQARIAQKADLATEDITNPDWQKVPGTGGSNPDFSSPAAVNVNGIKRWRETETINIGGEPTPYISDMATYDVVNPDGSYTRMESNCRKMQSRAIRQGQFESKTRVSFANLSDSLRDSDNSSIRSKLLRFVCRGEFDKDLSNNAKSRVTINNK